jgi:hypothetical protein
VWFARVYILQFEPGRKLAREGSRMQAVAESS